MSDAPPPDDTPPANGDAPPEGAPQPAGVRPAAPRPGGPRPWQGGRFHATTRRGAPSARRRTILILLAVILGLGGAVAAWFFYLGAVPKPHFTAIAVDQYRDPRVPVNLWTGQDAAALRGRGWQESNAFTSQQRNLLVEELGGLGRNQPADQPLVVYFRAYALPAPPTSDGGLMVLPGDATLDDESTGLPLADVFRLLKECPARRKLLLLDVMQPFIGARAGALAADAAGRADPVVRKAADDDPNLLVLCACAPGQTSLASEEMGHTVFVHYLIEGLAGKADGWGGGARDNRVSARELAAFVTANVDRWAWHNRAARQTPVLLGPDGLDFPLTVADENPAGADAPLDRAYPQGLREAWELRDRWKADLRVQTPPPLYRELEDDVMRAEDRWRGGADMGDVQAVLKDQGDRLEKRRNALPGAWDRGEPHSLALAAAVGRKPPPPDKVEEAIDQLRRLADLQRLAGPPTPDPAAAAQLETRKKAFLKDYENKPFELSWTVFQAAKEHPETPPEALRFWLGLLQPEGKPAPDYAEIHFLEALAALDLKDPSAKWPKELVAAALQLVEEAERAEAELKLCAPVAAAPLAEWLRKWGEEADDRRQKALDLLLGGKQADWAAAAKPLDAALNDGRGVLAFKETLMGLRAALRCRDDALVLLPECVAYFDHDAGREGEWRKAFDQTRSLRARLANPPADSLTPEWFGETGRQTQALRRSLDNLAQPFDSRRLRGLIAQSPRSAAADAEDMRAVLSLPALAAPDRLALWAAWRELAGRLNDETPSLEAGASPEPLPPFDAEKAKREELGRAALRFVLWRGLVTLDSNEDMTKLELDLVGDARGGNDKALLLLGLDLRDAWKRSDGSRPR